MISWLLLTTKIFLQSLLYIQSHIIYELQWTNETLLYKNISLILFSKETHRLLLVWEIDGETYTQREDFFPYLSSGSQGVPTLAPPCQLVKDASDRLRVPRSTAILCTLSKSDRVVLITWSPSGYTPVVPECPDRAALFTNHNVTACH